MNVDNFKLVLDKITQCPEQWDQSVWHCSSAHCFAGWAQILSGAEFDRTATSTRRAARMFLDISRSESDWLFSHKRTLEDFSAFLEKPDFAAPDLFNKDGLNCEGFDHNGYDKHGYDRDGYGRDRYDKEGYDRSGYDRLGFNREGYDLDGLDKDNKPCP